MEGMYMSSELFPNSSDGDFLTCKMHQTFLDLNTAETGKWPKDCKRSVEKIIQFV